MSTDTASSSGPEAAVEWEPDWDAMGDLLVRRSLQVQPGERVVYMADPSLYPRLLDAVREAVLNAGGIEQATMLNWTSRLELSAHSSGLGNTGSVSCTSS